MLVFTPIYALFPLIDTHNDTQTHSQMQHDQAYMRSIRIHTSTYIMHYAGISTPPSDPRRQSTHHIGIYTQSLKIYYFPSIPPCMHFSFSICLQFPILPPLFPFKSFLIAKLSIYLSFDFKLITSQI